jgi:hypothetical protein
MVALPVPRIIGHREWASDPCRLDTATTMASGRKPDPVYNMSAMRRRIAGHSATPIPTPEEEDDMALFKDRAAFDAAIDARLKYIVPRALSVAFTGATNAAFKGSDWTGRHINALLAAQIAPIKVELAASAAREASLLAILNQLQAMTGDDSPVDYDRLKTIVDAAATAALGEALDRIDVVVQPLPFVEETPKGT